MPRIPTVFSIRQQNASTLSRISAPCYFDSTVGEVRVTDADPNAVAELADSVRWIEAQLPHFTSRDWPRLVGPAHQEHDGAEDQAFLSWMSTLDMARASSLPLWADDLGLRTLARGDGVAAFGTVALLEVLYEDEAFTDGQVTSLLRSLRQQYVVDLPADEPWLEMSAASSDWAPGPATAYFTRPASWADLAEDLPLWDRLARAGAAENPANVVPWVVSGARGVMRAARPGWEHRLVALLATKGIAFAQFDPDATAAVTASVRFLCAERGHPNPVPLILSTLHSHLADRVGTEGAAKRMITAGAKMDHDDMTALRAVVLGIHESPTPPTR